MKLRSKWCHHISRCCFKIRTFPEGQDIQRNWKSIWLRSQMRLRQANRVSTWEGFHLPYITSLIKISTRFCQYYTLPYPFGYSMDGRCCYDKYLLLFQFISFTFTLPAALFMWWGGNLTKFCLPNIKKVLYNFVTYFTLKKALLSARRMFDEGRLF